MEKLEDFTSGYHSQANKQVEQAAHNTKNFLKNFQFGESRGLALFSPMGSPKVLYTILPYALPFWWVLKYKPPIIQWNANPTESPLVDDWFNQSKQMWDSIHQYLEQVATMNKVGVTHNNFMKMCFFSRVNSSCCLPQACWGLRCS